MDNPVYNPNSFQEERLLPEEEDLPTEEQINNNQNQNKEEITPQPSNDIYSQPNIPQEEIPTPIEQPQIPIPVVYNINEVDVPAINNEQNNNSATNQIVPQSVYK